MISKSIFNAEKENKLRFEAERQMVLQEDMAADSKKIDADIRRLKGQEDEFL